MFGELEASHLKSLGGVYGNKVDQPLGICDLEYFVDARPNFLNQIMSLVLMRRRFLGLSCSHFVLRATYGKAKHQINFYVIGIMKSWRSSVIMFKRIIIKSLLSMDDLRFRLNFNLSEKNEIYHHS